VNHPLGIHTGLKWTYCQIKITVYIGVSIASPDPDHTIPNTPHPTPNLPSQKSEIVARKQYSKNQISFLYFSLDCLISWI